MIKFMTALALCCAFAFSATLLADTDQAAAEPLVGGEYVGGCDASWYGPGFYGNLTASGEVYTGAAGTAAHPTLPFGTVLYVENAYTGAFGVVTVTDRGPYAYGRCLDVSAGSSYLVSGATGYLDIWVLEYGTY